jgi:hypothetical protein
MDMGSLHDDFFTAFEAAYAPLTTVHTDKTPQDMVAGPVNADGWVEWRMRPCTVPLDDIFAKYVHAAGKALPPSFQRWYASTFTLDCDCSVLRLPANPSNSPGKPLLQYVVPGNRWWERPLALGQLPFGDEGNDSGPLCFDTRASNDPGRWPITFWDHDGQEEIGPALFSSFDALLRGCTAYMRCFAEVKRRVPDPNDWLPNSDDCIRSLMAADPQGAGRPAAGYWRSWIAG